MDEFKGSPEASRDSGIGTPFLHRRSEKSRGLSVENSGRWTVFLVVCSKLSQNFGEWPNTETELLAMSKWLKNDDEQVFVPGPN